MADTFKKFWDTLSKSRDEYEDAGKITQAHESLADRLMSEENKIMNKLGVKSGGQLKADPKKWEAYVSAVGNISVSSVPPEVLSILEDNNFHTLVSALQEAKGAPKMFKDIGNPLTKQNNPWAICTEQVGRENKEKYESCVMGLKEKMGLHKDMTEDDWEHMEWEGEFNPVESQKSITDQLAEKLISENKDMELKAMLIAEGWENYEIDSYINSIKQSLNKSTYSLSSDDKVVFFNEIIRRFGSLGIDWEVPAREYLVQSGVSSAAVDEIISELKDESGQLNKMRFFKSQWRKLLK